MKSSNTHAILSELHRLLSVYSASDLAQASEYRGISPRVRDALRALTEESQRDSGGGIDYSRDSREVQPQRIAPEVSRLSWADLSTEIANSIRRQSERFSSTASILNFAKDAGLNVQARHKESRERLARRVAEAILQIREPKRTQILAVLAGNGDSQTQGWIDVIKNRRS